MNNIMSSKETTIYWDTVDTPIGDIRLYATQQGLCYVCLPADTESTAHEYCEKIWGKTEWVHDSLPIDKYKTQLKEYFNKKRVVFDLNYDLHGTLFQKSVWKTLLKIPYGHTWSYQKLAHNIGHPRAYRAVGRANGANPLPIFIPCHRVIAVQGKLGGYSGGLEVKRFLLSLEGSPVVS
ncbi:methylated-DNA--[protein]-cysteine S-methyltransferase [Alicyclobacillus tolerans]|nr:methylated-DNA--[protein]-cysteine S-methyltransferase [Alicyclobacillus tengchongensis]